LFEEEDSFFDLDRSADVFAWDPIQGMEMGRGVRKLDLNPRLA